MLTHSTFHTMCCWMHKMRVQRTSEHDLGPTTEFSVPSPDPIWPSELHYTRARIRAGFLRTEIVWHTSQSPHTYTRPHCHFDWRMGIDWLRNVGYGPMRNHIYPTHGFVPYSRTDAGKWGDSHANKFYLRKRAWLLPMHACHGCVALTN